MIPESVRFDTALWGHQKASELVRFGSLADIFRCDDHVRFLIRGVRHIVYWTSQPLPNDWTDTDIERSIVEAGKSPDLGAINGQKEAVEGCSEGRKESGEEGGKELKKVQCKGGQVGRPCTFSILIVTIVRDFRPTHA
jgi:hypothetical protein